MNSEELKRACEMAGLRISMRDKQHWLVAYDSGHMWADDVALPPYVAELLVAKVSERIEDSTTAEFDRISDIFRTQCGRWGTATGRIRACMAVLS